MKRISALALALLMVSGSVFAAEAAATGAANAAGGAAPGGAAVSGVAGGNAVGPTTAEITLGIGAAVLFIAAASQSTTSH